MPVKTYTVRVPAGTPDINSEQVAAWLDTQSSSNELLASDPGAGERTLRLSLDHNKVKGGAQAVGEVEAVFLRRLIATNVRVPEGPSKSEAEVKPKLPVLKGTLRLQPEQVMPLVRLFEAGQSLIIRRALQTPEAVHEAAFSEGERELLATGTAEVINRRAPARLVQNIDIVGLAVTIVAIEARKIEAVQAVAELKRQSQRQSPQSSQSLPSQPVVEMK